MNKRELVSKIYSRKDIRRTVVLEVINALIEECKDTLASGEEFKLDGLFTLKPYKSQKGDRQMVKFVESSKLDRYLN